MKWNNRGKEYEDLREIFSETNNIYIYGENVDSIECYSVMKKLGLQVKIIKKAEQVSNSISFGLKSVLKYVKQGDFNKIKNSVARRLMNRDGKFDIEYADLSMLQYGNSIVLVSFYDAKDTIVKIADRFGLNPGETIFPLKKWMRFLFSSIYGIYSRKGICG